MKAVLTGDLVHSRGYTTSDLSHILDVLRASLDAIPQASFKLFRGDSFQGVINTPETALDIALQLKIAINKIVLEGAKELPDIRISIGIGAIDLTRESILESNGEAFQFSGIGLDNLKGDYRRLALMTPDDEINGEFTTSLALLDSLMSKWSTASAEVVYYLIQGHTEQEIASKLGISQAAVNARKKVAQWDAMKGLMARFEHVISKLKKDG